MRPFLAIFVALLLVPAPGIRSASIDMATGRLFPMIFKFDVSALSAEEKRVFEYALKQWIMYDKAPLSTASDGGNWNSTGQPFVMAPGTSHNTGNFQWRNPETGDRESKARTARSISPTEKAMMVKRYGAQSRFHKAGEPVRDPTTEAGRAQWFTTDPKNTMIKVKKYDQVPGEASSVLGKASYATYKQHDDEFKTVALAKDLPEGQTQAEMQLRSVHPKGKAWCYPTDTDGDGWITNKDAPCPKDTHDYYFLVKHELGHFFCFTHQGSDFSEHEGGCCPDHGPPADEAPLNSPDNEGGASHGKDADSHEHPSRMYFHSDRPGGLGGYDIYYSIWDDNMVQWGPPQNCGAAVNSPFDELDPQSGNADGYLLFSSNRPGGLGNFDIYQAVRADTARWDSVYALPGINSPFNEFNPQQWHSRQVYFSSDRPGGQGNLDLWVAMTVDTFSFLWNTPQNLGPQVNSPANDTDPFVVDVSPDFSSGELYFASDRPGGMGQMDLFKVTMDSFSFNPPQNLGPQVNSPDNDRGPEIDPHFDFLYYESDRPLGPPPASEGSAALVGPWNIFKSPNIAPRPWIISEYGDAGDPGDTLQVQFSVHNDGMIPLVIAPTVTTNSAWAYSWDATPFFLDPDSFLTYTVDVIVDLGASIGDETRVYLTAVAGPVAVTDSASAWSGGPTSAPDPRQPTYTNELRQNYPNPFNPATTVEFTVATPGVTTLRVYDVAGRVVRTLHDEYTVPGTRHRLVWDGRNNTGQSVVSGVYFYQLRTPDVTINRKMVLLR